MVADPGDEVGSEWSTCTIRSAFSARFRWTLTSLRRLSMSRYASARRAATWAFDLEPDTDVGWWGDGEEVSVVVDGRAGS